MFNQKLNFRFHLKNDRIQLRNVHLKHPMFQSTKFHVTGSARKTLEKKLGFVLQPKLPLSAYFRFMKEVRPSVIAAHPKLKQKQLCAIFSKMWSSLDATEKEKYIAEYKNEMLKYSDTLKNYKSQLTDDQKRIIEEKVSEGNTKKIIKSYKDRASKLGKPKRPATLFLKYFHEQTDRKPDEEYKVYMKRMSRRWSRLTKAEKEKYKATAEELENYK